MAYAFKFGPDVTRLIESMRDWKLEDVKRRGGTPSRLALFFYVIRSDPPHPVFTCDVEENEYVINHIRSKWMNPYPHVAPTITVCKIKFFSWTGFSYEQRLVIRTGEAWDLPEAWKDFFPGGGTLQTRCPRSPQAAP